jgi:bile acid:Na+ symporter, BASS family
VSMLPFWLCGWPRPDKLSVGIEVTMRNLNLALLLKALLFPSPKGDDPVADGVLFVVLFYAAVALFSGLPLALVFRLKARRAALRAQAPEPRGELPVQVVARP